MKITEHCCNTAGRVKSIVYAEMYHRLDMIRIRTNFFNGCKFCKWLKSRMVQRRQYKLNTEIMFQTSRSGDTTY